MSSSSSSGDVCTVVMVLGSSTIQAGFAGSDAPRCVEPSVVGIEKKTVKPMMLGMSMDIKYCGDHALQNCETVDLTYPIERGAVKDWYTFETLMTDVLYNNLRVIPDECNLLIAEAPLNPRENREKLLQLFFETYNVPQMRIEIDGVLSMYSKGGTTGLSVSSGGGVTSVLPVFEGYAIQNAMKRLDIGGSDVTEYLTRLLTERGYYFRTSTDREIVRRIKESLAYVSCNFNQDMATYCTQWFHEMEKTYELPDGNIIMIADQLFRCTECLFQPLTQLGREHVGIHQLIHNSIKECDIDVRRDLYSNIMLTGGNTMLPGFPERIQKEITNLAPPKSQIRMLSPPERKYSVWIGGSVLASVSLQSGTWISKQQYDETGPTVMRTPW